MRRIQLLYTTAMVMGVAGALALRPTDAAAQPLDCDVCEEVEGYHHFTAELELCTTQNRAENPSCRDCDTTPTGHIGCHAAPTNLGHCSSHGGPSCGPSEGEQQLAALVRSGEIDARQITALLLEHHELSFNLQRHAVQGVGCTGAVILHVTLTTDLASAVQVRLEAASRTTDRRSEK